MKKVIYLLVLCMVLGMAGCGTNQENKEPVSGNVSVEIENKENDDVVQNEQTADTGSYPPCVMVDGVIYKDTGYVASMPGCGTMDGEIVSTVAGTELPSENNQSNFGSGYHYQRSSEGQLIVVIDDERIIFRDIEKDDTSIPIEVINFNAKVKEITDDGELLVTHVSTAVHRILPESENPPPFWFPRPRRRSFFWSSSAGERSPATRSCRSQ